ncbi:hypothetical protein [Streptomyces sp. NPDC101455]|uniref:hypothetical protein n=1 Tax=Streptomyces sp. NPDC101455 TaxID=3366142 RepID=UPI00380E3826
MTTGPVCVLTRAGYVKRVGTNAAAARYQAEQDVSRYDPFKEFEWRPDPSSTERKVFHYKALKTGRWNKSTWALTVTEFSS